MGWFKKKELKEVEERVSLADVLQGSVGNYEITSEMALNIPSVSACISAISNTVATIPIKLYKDFGKNIAPVEDNRVKLLNEDTGDTLDSFQWKEALISDYLLKGVGYTYINRERNYIKSLHYVDEKNVTININTDPIFKTYDIVVNAQFYKPWQFIKLTRRTKDGVQGRGIIQENQKILSVAYNALLFEEVLVKTGGNKKGYLKSKNKLLQGALDDLKAAWKKLYSNNAENVVVLNDGLEFQEASNTSVEMQLNENKKSNAAEICKIFNVPIGIISGNATEEDTLNYNKNCILPILKAFETALNKELLLTSEKSNEDGSFYFCADTKQLMKGDLLKRYQSYEIAIRSGIQTIDEVRYSEDLEDLELNFLKLGLDAVLYNVDSKDIFVTNTGQIMNMNNPAPIVDKVPNVTNQEA